MDDSSFGTTRIKRLSSLRASASPNVINSRRRTASSQSSRDASVFCDHLRLSTTCVECICATSLQDSGLSSMSSLNSSATGPVIVPWSSSAFASTPLNSSSLVPSAHYFDEEERYTSDDEDEWEFFDLSSESYHHPCEDDCFFVAKSQALPLKMSSTEENVPSNNNKTQVESYKPVKFDLAPPRPPPPRVNSRPSLMKSDNDVVRPKASNNVSAQSTDSIAQWTFPIVVGTVVLGNLFGFGLEFGAVASTLAIYLFRLHALPLLDKYLN